MHDVGETPVSPAPNPRAYPAMVTLAGVIWIVVGAGIVGNFVLALLLGIGMEHGMGSGSTALHPLVPMIVDGLFQAVVGGFFLYEGACICRGTVPSTVGVAIGSILFAAVFVGMAVFLPDLQKGYQAILPWIVAAGLIVAGTLALRGRAAYDTWWKMQHRQRSKRHDGP